MQTIFAIIITLLASVSAQAACENATPKDAEGNRHGTIKNCFGNGSWEEWLYEHGTETQYKRFNSSGIMVKHVFKKDGKANGATREWFDDGKPKITSNYQDFKLHGPYEEYSSYSNKVKEKGFYQMGERHGPWILYNDRTGALAAKQHYDHGKKVGTWEEYYDNGKLEWERNYQDDKLHGESKYFNQKGRIEKLDTYVNGDSTGWRLQFHDNSYGHYLKYARWEDANRSKFLASFHHTGQVDEFTCYIDGRGSKDLAPCKTQLTALKKLQWVKSDAIKNDAHLASGYFADGKPKEKCLRTNGKKEGECTYFYQNGKVRSTGKYTNDNPTGIHKTFYETGKLASETEHQGENLTKTEFFESGSKKKITNVEKGNIVSYTDFYMNGNPKETGAWQDKKFSLVEYHDNGNKRYEGTKTATTRCWYGCYNELTQDGWIKWYYESGKIRSKTQYVKGQQDGRDITYYENGNVLAEEVYQEGRKVSSKYYDETGKLMESVEYFPDGSKKATAH